ncbi:hypothetical protein RND81_13G058400 [Saponaria officinalis]|uniref:Uncharacterized protein n=1 Tax=Saponaria officinalis TaxID=3572 RepID=A0AAW1GWH1_SAPOF
MALKPLSEEAIALTEKKMDMSLDDIIKMSKTDAGKKKQREPIKSRGNYNRNHDRSFKVRQFVDSRSTLRQGAFAQKRSSFQGNFFPLAAEAARKAANATFHNRPFNHRNAGNWNKTRPGGPPRRQGNASNGSNALTQQQRQKQHQRQNQQQQQQHQEPLPREEMIHNQKPKTLDSLFANMKEQRMRAFNRPNNGSNARVGFAFNQPRQPWLRGRFGTYRN